MGFCARTKGWLVAFGCLVAAAIVAIVLVGLLRDLAAPVGDPASESRFMGRDVSFVLDNGGIGAVDATTLPAILARMEPANGKMPGVGLRYYDGGRLWFAFTAPVLDTDQADRVVKLNNARVREARIIVVKDGVFSERAWTFDGPLRRGMAARIPAFHYDRAELDGATVLMGFNALGAMRAEVFVETGRAFEAGELTDAVATSILGGALLAMAFYLVVIGLRLREPTLLAAAGVSFFTGNFIFGVKGYITSALLHRFVNASELFLYATQPALLTFILLLIVTYLDLGRRTPRLAVALVLIALVLPLQGVMVTARAIGLPIPFVFDNTAPVMAGMLAGLATLVGFSVAGDRRAAIFLLCLMPFVLGSVLRLVVYFSRFADAGTLAFANSYVDVVLSMMLLGIMVVLDLQRRETALRRSATISEARFRDYAELATDSYFEATPDGRVANAAGRLARGLGLVEGAPLRETLAGRLGAVSAQQLDAFALALSQGGTLRDIEVKATLIDGDSRWLSISAGPPHGVTGPAPGLRGTIADITERVDRRQNEARENTLSALGALAGAVAHEVNNLLHPMVNLARRVRDRPAQDEESRRLLDLVVTSGHHAGEIVTAVLNAFNPARAPGPRLPIETALADAVAACRATLPEAVMLTLHPPAFGGGTVVAPGEMLQVVANLTANAVRAMDGAGRIDVALDRQPDGALRFAFADDGPGMPEAIRSNATEPFVSGRFDGTGLGLSVVAGIARKWGGVLSIEAPETGGTRIVIILPATDANRPTGDPTWPAS